MTSVVPRPPIAAVALTASTSGAGVSPSTDFADWLDPRDDENALAFSALGVLGRRGADAGGNLVAPDCVVGTLDAIALPDMAVSDRAGSAMQQRSGADERLVRLGVSGWVGSITAPWVGPVPSAPIERADIAGVVPSLGATSSATSSSIADGPDNQQQRDGSARASRFLAQARLEPNPVRVSAHVAGSETHVIIRAAGIAEEDRVRLRRLLAATAAGYGLSLGELRLNGKSVHDNVKGGIHGACSGQ